jgi:hypothetical protein
MQLKQKLSEVRAQFIRKWADKKERRVIVAFAAASAFLMFSFWNSFQDRRLQSDIKKATIKETMQSGRILPGGFDSSQFVIARTVIDEKGQVVSIDSYDPEAAEAARSIRFTPMTVNGKHRKSQVPIAIALPEKSFRQTPLQQ